MDRVRFGRALGFGARQAMKTLLTAADAATSPNPSGTRPNPAATPSRPEIIQPRTPATQPVSNRAAKATQAVTRTASQARKGHRGLTRGTQRFGHAVWSPFVRLSGVLWLEVTGVFFGILALFAAQGAWKARGELHPGGSHQHLLGAAAMLAVFGYFCVSSFIRAHRRQHHR